MIRNTAVSPDVSLPVHAAVFTGLDALRANPLRTLLSTIGVVMGAASLAAVLSLGDGAESFARERIAFEGLQRITLEARTDDLFDGHRVPRSRYPIFTPADAQGVAAALPGTEVRLEVTGTALTGCPDGTSCVEFPSSPGTALARRPVAGALAGRRRPADRHGGGALVQRRRTSHGRQGRHPDAEDRGDVAARQCRGVSRRQGDHAGPRVLPGDRPRGGSAGCPDAVGSRAARHGRGRARHGATAAGALPQCDREPGRGGTRDEKSPRAHGERPGRLARSGSRRRARPRAAGTGHPGHPRDEVAARRVHVHLAARRRDRDHERAVGVGR